MMNGTDMMGSAGGPNWAPSTGSVTGPVSSQQAIALADVLMVLEGGRIVQVGSAADVTQHPRSRYVADLAGVQPLPGYGLRRTGGAGRRLEPGRRRRRRG